MGDYEGADYYDAEDYEAEAQAETWRELAYDLPARPGTLR